MSTRVILPALFLGVGLGLTALLSSPAAEKADTKRIVQLIKDLGSEKFEDRDRASQELEAIGAPALEALKKAVKMADLETQRRAEELVRKIENRRGNERALTATKVRLKYKDTPVLEAIADLVKQTGFSISYMDDEAKLKGRTVTLDTGEMTFWQAFDLFCQKAGVVEGHALRNVKQPAIGIAGGAPVPAAQPVKPLPPNVVVPVAGPYRFITLMDGKPPVLPTDYVGAMRVRTLGVEMELRNPPPRQAREIRLILDVAPEPGVDFQQVPDLRIDRAQDEKGQSLEALKTAAVNPANAPVNAAGLVATARPAFRQMLVRLEAAAQPSRLLKELKGSILARIRTAPQIMATVDDLLKSSGKTFKGEQGVSITVREVKKLEDGQVALHVALERPADVYPYIPPSNAAGVAPAGPGLPIQIQPIQPGNIQIRPIQIQIQPLPAAPKPVPPQAVPPQPGGPVEKAPNPAPPNALPPKNVPPNPAPQPVPPVPAGQPQIQPAPQPAVAGRSNLLAFLGLSVHDAKNERLALHDVRSVGQRLVKGVYTYEVLLTVKPRPEQRDSIKLVFTGTRLVPVEVSFTLKDVPLP